MFRCAVREPAGEKEGGKTVFYYGVVTELDLPTYGGRRSLHTQRRYSDFEALHAALSAAAGPRRLPPLPAKNPFAAFGGDKIMEERRSAFESLMAYVGGDELLRQHPLVAEFVGATPYPAQPQDAPSAAPVAPVGAAASAPPARAASPPPPAVVEKPTWKAHPFEDALSALSVADAPAAKKADAAAPRAPPAAAAASAAPKAAPKPTAATPSKPSAFTPFSFGTPSASATSAAAGPPGGAYEKSGEGVRDAIKAGDAPGAAALLAAGVDPNYVDAQGMSLLHVAAVFNAAEIALALLGAGARADARNAQGETPLDCAPPSLAHRLKARAEAMAAERAAA